MIEIQNERSCTSGHRMQRRRHQIRGGGSGGERRFLGEGGESDDQYIEVQPSIRGRIKVINLDVLPMSQGRGACRQ